MLTGHKEGSKHVGNLPVSDSTPVLVLLTTKSSHHVVFILGAIQGKGATDKGTNTPSCSQPCVSG